MENLLKEIENNLITLRWALKRQGIKPPRAIQVELWDNKLGFKIGAWTGEEWIGADLDCLHSREMFLKIIERKRILFRKFGGV